MVTSNLGIFYYTLHQTDSGAFGWGECNPADYDCGTGIIPCNACYHQLPGRWSGRYLPELGLYNNGTDSIVMRQHLKWIQDAGIGFVMFSWWGKGSPSDIGLSLLMNEISGYPGLKFCIYYEAEAYGNPALIADIDYLNAKCFGHSNYYHVNGKPMIWVYNENLVSDVQRWVVLKQSRSLYVVLKEVPGYSGISGIDSWHQYGPASRTGKTGSYSSFVSPGFFRYHSCERLQRIDLHNSWTEFDIALSIMKNDGCTWHTIQTFNEWMECSGIEPAAYYDHTIGATNIIPYPKVNNSYSTRYLDLINKYFGSGTGGCSSNPICLLNIY